MAMMQLARPYEQTQADPFGSFQQGQQQANALANQQMVMQHNRLAQLQAEQSAQQQNQLNTLVPQTVGVTDPAQRKELSQQLAGLGPQGQNAMSAAQQRWNGLDAGKKAALADGVNKASRFAVAAFGSQDPNLSAQYMNAAYQAMKTSGAPDSAIQTFQKMSPKDAAKALIDQTMPMKDIIARSGFGPANVQQVKIPDGRGNMVTGYLDKNSGMVHTLDGHTIDARTGQVQGGQSVPSGMVTPDGKASPQLVNAVIRTESNGNPNAVSPKGAVGAMQVMPATAASIGFPNADLTDPQVNVHIGQQYLNQQLQKYRDPQLALAAYNAGPGAVDKLIQQYGPSYAAISAHLPAETQAYVPKVLGQVQGGQPAPPPQDAMPPVVKGALGHALTAMTQPQQPANAVPQNQGEPGPQAPPQGDAGQPGMPQEFDAAQSGAAQKLVAIQQQAGHLLTPVQLLQATGAPQELIQATLQASGLQPNDPIDVTKPDTATQLYTGMYKAAQAMPHLLPGQAQEGEQVPQGAPEQAPVNSLASTQPVEDLPFGTSAGSVTGSKAPSGYRFASNGQSLEPIPGGPADKGISFQGESNAALFGDPTLAGKAYVDSIPAGNSEIVKGLLNGTVALPTGTTLKNPLWQSALASVKHADPAWNQAAYKQFADTRKFMTTGKGGSLVNSINTAAQHLQKLVDDVDALDNGQITGINKLGNFLSRQTGGQAITDFTGDLTPVASELAAVYKNGGTPTDQETQHWREALTADMSHGQQMNVIRGWIELLSGKLNATRNQYQSSMSPLSEPLSVINPKAAQALERITTLANKVSTTGQHSMPAEDTSPINAPGGQASQGPVAVNSKTGEKITWNGSAWVPVQ